MNIKTIGKTQHNLILDKYIYDIAKKYEWRCKRRKEHRWFYTLIDGKEHSLKSVLFQLNRNTILVHKNGNDLDFTSCNLEILTRQEYAHKYISGYMDKKSKYNNVTWENAASKWKVRFIKDNKVAYERYFIDEYDAAVVADYKSYELYGNNSKFNIENISKDELECLYRDLMNKYGEERRDIKSKSNQGDSRIVGTSKYVGVHIDRKRNKWIARIKKAGKIYWCGYHRKEIDAAKAYNKKALELYGEGAKLNEV